MPGLSKLTADASRCITNALNSEKARLLNQAAKSPITYAALTGATIIKFWQHADHTGQLFLLGLATHSLLVNLIEAISDQRKIAEHYTQTYNTKQPVQGGTRAADNHDYLSYQTLAAVLSRTAEVMVISSAFFLRPSYIEAHNSGNSSGYSTGGFLLSAGLLVEIGAKTAMNTAMQKLLYGLTTNEEAASEISVLIHISAVLIASGFLYLVSLGEIKSNVTCTVVGMAGTALTFYMTALGELMKATNNRARAWAFRRRTSQQAGSETSAPPPITDSIRLLYAAYENNIINCEFLPGCLKKIRYDIIYQLQRLSLISLPIAAIIGSSKYPGLEAPLGVFSLALFVVLARTYARNNKNTVESKWQAPQTG